MELTIEQALQQGIAAHKEGKLQEAERLYRAILQSQPLHPDANHNLGVLAVSANKAESALSFFKSALDTNPKIGQFWLSYINALIQAKQFKNAKQIAEEAKAQGVVEEDLDTLVQHLSQIEQESSSISLEQKTKKEAVKEHLEANHPSQHLMDRLLGHFQNERFSDAEKLAVNITQNFPEHQFAWKVLGAVLGATGRNSEAEDVNQTAVALAPLDATAHNNLGNALKGQGNLDEAKACYRQALTLKPDYAEAYYNLGSTLQAQDRLEEAEESFRKAIDYNPNMGDAYLGLSSILSRRGNLEESSNVQIKGLELTSAKAISGSSLKNVIPKFVMKMQEQNGIPTFFDQCVFSHLRNKPNLPVDICGIFEDGQSSKDNRFVSFSEREKSISVSMPSGRLFDGIPLASSQGIHSRIKWKEHSLYKTSSDLVLYWMILQDIQPDVVIELGSGDGGSAIWLADMAYALGLDTHVYSYDINKPELNHPRVTFIEYDLMNIDQQPKPPCWEFFIGGKLLIEDAHVNVRNVLDLFDNFLSKDDYLIVEDSDAKQEIIRDFAVEKEPKYKLDQFFLDFFGTNITCSMNAIFRVF